MRAAVLKRLMCHFQTTADKRSVLVGILQRLLVNRKKGFCKLLGQILGNLSQMMQPAPEYYKKDYLTQFYFNV